MDLRLGGRAFVVSGGSRGIGRAVVLALLAEGACVGACARDARALEQLGREAGEHAGRLATRSLDVREPQATARFVHDVAARFGRLDGLVAGAGFGTTGTIEAATWPEIADQFEVKVASVLNLVRPGLEHLGRSDAGRVVVLNGVTAHAPEADMAAVGVARAAVAHLTALLARQVAGRGICVNRVNLGPILTDRQRERHRRTGQGQDFEAWSGAEAERRGVPLGRLGTVAEVVPWVLMLLSPLASYVTGAALDVSGGLGTRV